ncbi:MAG: hypothetical protein ACKOHI_12000 [Phycisphaerales bacterium]
MDRRDPHREASVLTALRNGEIAGPKDIDAEAAARKAVAEACDLRAESVRGDPCRKRCTRTVAVAQVVGQDRRHHESTDRECAQHFRKCRHARPRSVGQDHCVDRLHAEGRERRHDATRPRITVRHAAGIDKHRARPARDHVARPVAEFERGDDE